MHELVSTTRLLADHGQFYAFDRSANPYEPLPEITAETVRRGWTRNRHAIYYFTVGRLWDYRLDLYRSRGSVELDGAQRLLAHNLTLPSGELVVGNPIASENVASLSVTPGDYALYLRAFNLGAEAEEDLDDELFLARSCLERYELIVAQGATRSEGVIEGDATLW